MVSTRKDDMFTLDDVRELGTSMGKRKREEFREPRQSEDELRRKLLAYFIDGTEFREMVTMRIPAGTPDQAELVQEALRYAIIAALDI